MRKRLLSGFIAMLLVCGTVLGALVAFPLKAAAESLYIRKIVSVVYDDSGSMGSATTGTRWAYANYAMQAFCGMLNSQDQLYVTYMSAVKNDASVQSVPIGLSENEIGTSLQNIRNHSDVSGSTPYKAIQVAFDKLKSVQDSNPNTQYWLVVITDGEFVGYSHESSDLKTALNQSFTRYSETVMPNGSTPQSTFLAIGSGVTAPDENPEKNIFTYEAADASRIVDTMSKMANRISGRRRLEESDIQKVDAKTIRVSSSVPLTNIAVLTQNSSAQISRATDPQGKNISVMRKAPLYFKNSNVEMSGGSYLLGNERTVIPAGTYTLTFDSAIDLTKTVVLFEPALDVRMKIFVNGREVTDITQLDNLQEKDKLSVSCKVYETGTDNEISASLLPTDTKYEIVIKEGGRVVASNQNVAMSLSDYVLKNVATEITASVEIGGFNPIRSSVYFTPTKYVPKVYSLKAEYGGSATSVKYDDIASNKDLSICFTVLVDGVPVTDTAAVKALNPRVTTSVAGNEGAVSYTNDGKIVFTPNRAQASTQSGDGYDVGVTCAIDGGATATKSYKVLFTKYSMSAALGSATDSVKLKDIASNKDLAVVFTVYADGVPLTDTAAVKALNPRVTTSVAGNEGAVSYTSDGKIVFTPNRAHAPVQSTDGYDVDVTCTIDGGATATKSYRVLLTKYSMTATLGSTTDSVKLKDIASNKELTVVFTVYEDGSPLTDTAAVKALNPRVVTSLAGNSGTISYTDDGRIVFTPNQASAPEQAAGRYEVDVTCSLDGGISASQKYTVMLTQYTVKAEFGSGAKSVKYDDIAQNKDMTICFTVLADGEPMTDSDAVKALVPTIVASPQGNSGTVTYTDDGKIVFTPNAAPVVSGGGQDSFEVRVTCTVGDGASASETYTVLVSDYQIIPIEVTDSIVKTKFFGNTVGASFYITKDGVRLGKADVEQGIAVELNGGHAKLLTNVTVSDDGVITITPYSDDEYKLTFKTWWGNWLHYLRLEGDDMVVTLHHPFGSAENVIDVRGESVQYLLLNVILPAFIELAAIIFILYWIFCIIVKPRYAKGAVLYVGNIYYDDLAGAHVLSEVQRFELAEYNKIKWGNGWCLPTWRAKKITVGGIEISAARGGGINCYQSFPWYKGEISPCDRSYNTETPEDLAGCFNEALGITELPIKEFKPAVTVDGSMSKVLEWANRMAPLYIVAPNDGGIQNEGGRDIITSGYIFIYTI